MPEQSAIESLHKYPVPLLTGDDALILEGIGPSTAKQLNKKLLAYIKKHKTNKTIIHDVLLDRFNLSQTNCALPLRDITNRTETSARSKSSQNKRKRKASYIPGERTGGWAIMLALYIAGMNANYKGFLFKSEIIERASGFSRTSFYKDSESYYTAWNGIKTLLNHKLVNADGSRKVKYTLTDKGNRIAKGIYDSIKDDASLMKQVVRNDNEEVFASHIVNIEQHVAALMPKHVRSSHQVDRQRKGKKIKDIKLIIDTREIKSRKERKYMHDYFEKKGIDYDVRQLALGDFMWVGVDKYGEEICLDYIVERKAMADLASSIIDGRYSEQKHRLGKCGLEKVVYLVEGDLTTYNRSYCNISPNTLKSAMYSTVAGSKYIVKLTKTTKESMDYLLRLTRYLEKYYRVNRTNGPTYEAFKVESGKSNNFTCQQTFAIQLAVIKGLSIAKTSEVVKRYPTPYMYINKLSKFNQEDAIKRISDIKYGPQQRRIGKVASTKLIQLLDE